MALSGKVSAAFGPSGHYTLELDWSATQDIAANQSSITGQMWMWSDSSWSMYTSSTKYGNQKINGTNYPISQAGVNTGGGTWIKLGAQQSWVLTHNSDGTCSFTWGGDFNFGGVSINGTVINDVVLPTTTMYLDTIPRSTTLSSPNPPNWTAGNNVTFNLNRNSSSFSETVKLEVQDKSNANAWTTVNSYTGVGASCAFTFTTAQNTTIFKALNGTSSTSSRLTITTYSGYNSTGSVVGSAQVYTGTVSVPSVATVSAPKFNIGDIVTITLSGTKSDYTYDLAWSWVSYNSSIATGLTSSTYSWDTSTSDTVNGGTYASNMYANIPNANSDWGTLKVTTYYNGIQVGSTKNSAAVYAYVVNSNPTFSTGYYYQDTATSVTAITGQTGNNGAIVQNLSNVMVYLPTTANATGVNSATISYYVATLNGVSIQTNYSNSNTIQFNFGKVNASSDQTLYVKAVDSRGNYATTSMVVLMIPYAPPVINATAKRDDGFSNNSTVTLNGTYSPIMIGGITKNPLKTVQYQYGTVSSKTYGSAINFTYSTNSTSYTATSQEINSPTGLDNTMSWNVLITVADQFNTSTFTNTIGSGTPILFIDATLESVGVGKFPVNSGSFEVAGSLYVSGDSHTNWIYGNTGIDLTLQAASGQAIQFNSPVTMTNDVISSNYNSGDGYSLKSVGAFELRSTSAYPYIDWSLNGTDDYDLRMSVQSNSTLQLTPKSGDSGTTIEMPGTSASLRFAVAGTQSYIQSGMSSADANAQLVITRWGTTGTAIKNLFINATGVQFIGIQTTTTATSGVYMDSSGNFYRSTSSIKYKTDVEDLWESEYMKVLDLRPVMYRSKTSTDRKDWTVIGLIAEEVAEVEPRLVIYNGTVDDTRPTSELSPENVQYDKIGVMLIPIVKKLYAEIEELKKKQMR